VIDFKKSLRKDVYKALAKVLNPGQRFTKIKRDILRAKRLQDNRANKLRRNAP